MFNLNQWRIDASEKLGIIINCGLVAEYRAVLDAELEKLNGLSVNCESHAKEIIDAAASLSHCIKRRVAYLVLRDNKIISVGVNHNPTSFLCELEHDCSVTKNTTIHAEIHALSKLIDATNTAMVGSYEPCLPCVERILTMGVVSVHSFECGKPENQSNLGFATLARHGIACGTFKELLV